MQGWAPWCSRMSIRSTAARAPARRAGPRRSGRPAIVTAVRLCRVSKWKSRSSGAPDENASTISRRVPSRRPSEKFGTASSIALDEQLTRTHDGRAVERDVGLHHDAIEVYGHLDSAPDRRRGAERDVDGAEDLLVLEHVAGQLGLLVRADPELGDGGRLGAVLGQKLH